jgi:hypothetical protein
MPGLVPAIAMQSPGIHVFTAVRRSEDVDGTGTRVFPSSRMLKEEPQVENIRLAVTSPAMTRVARWFNNAGKSS